MPSSMWPWSGEERPANPHPLSKDAIRGGLFRDEYFWRNHQTWLAEVGYMLRPRYRMDWQPSWFETKKSILDCEDGLSTLSTIIMDAIRISDGRIVALKQVDRSRYPDEEDIARAFAMPSTLANDTRNHTAPIYDILQSPLNENVAFLVMPYLLRIDRVKFATVGEVVECWRQLFEGLQFMHQHHLAHCDIKFNNVMMDTVPLLSEIPHPTYWHSDKSYDFKRSIKTRTRTSYPPRYYYIDFGLSYELSPEEPSPRLRVALGGDKSAPEYKNRDAPLDPYKLDIYCLGNLIREHFINVRSRCFTFMKPLVEDMVQVEPANRPNMDDAFTRFESLRASLPQGVLRSRVVYDDEFGIPRLYRACRHVVRTLFWMATGTPALPSPPSSR
ncbi:kinase-like domain-containing protein [Dichomitus squalens]|uniref:Kinase-like domain-containing protein n=1 Tax=Dichomitus squalens TaxID=114155 RepID=A0A4Q9MY31_9APHY|nr:kinase-like domain-containing protein [Dichomitus squalens]